MGEVESQNIKLAAVRGVTWKIAGEAVRQVSRLLLLLILARLLVPSDFGIASIVLAFVMFVPVLSDLGLGATVIQRRELTELERSTAFWASVALGVTFMLVGVAFSWPLAALFDEPSLQPLFSVFALSFLVASLSSLPNALLMRAMDFKSLELRVIAGTICGVTAAITLAFLGVGAWAIVGGDLVGRTVSLVMLWLRCGWRPTLAFSWSTLKGMLAFGGAMLGAHLLMQLAQTLQNLMVGRLLGPQSLGRLTVSQTLVLLPFSRVAAPIQEVMFPTFSRMQSEPRRILNAWSRINQIVVVIALPALAGLAILAPEFTEIVLGDRWQGTEDVIRALALSGAALALQRLSIGVLSAVGFVRSLLWVGIASVVFTAFAILVGYRFGLTATAIALSGQAIVIQTALMTIAARSVGGRLADVVRPLVRIAVAAGVMAVVVGCVAALLRAAEAGDALTLLLGTLSGVLVFPPLLWKLEPDLIRYVVDFFRHRGRAQAGSPASVPVSAPSPGVAAEQSVERS